MKLKLFIGRNRIGKRMVIKTSKLEKTRKGAIPLSLSDIAVINTVIGTIISENNGVQVAK